MADIDPKLLARDAPIHRVHLARRDLDWLPPSLKAVHWTVAGAIWTSLAGATIATLALAKIHFYIYGKGIAMIAAGGYYAGDKAARFVLKKRLSRLASGAVDLGRLASREDGEIIHTRGRVRAETTIPALLSDEPCVYRRVTFTINETRLVHEAAVNFTLVDTAGEFIRVEVEGGRLVGRDRKAFPIDEQCVERLAALSLPAGVVGHLFDRRKRLGKGKRTPPLKAAEWLLRDGDEVELVGLKARIVDPTVHSRMERDTPMRATLRSSSELPLLIARTWGRQAR